jgi:hypothetical protein
MINMPQIQKAQRDLMGQIAVTFKGDDGKEFERYFSEMRAGISWPIRDLPGYVAILGLFSGAIFGKADSLMLVYEKEYRDSVELITDAYNKANDLRFRIFYTNLKHPEWRGYNDDFYRKIRSGLGARDIRLMHSRYENEFSRGKDVINRLASENAFHIPSASLLMTQLRNMKPKHMQTENPEHIFHAVNGFRYLLVQWELEKDSRRVQTPREEERKITVKGWA